MPGTQQLRVEITEPNFNLNWMEFTLLTQSREELFVSNLNVFPNPSADYFLIQGEFYKVENVEIVIHNFLGQEMSSRKIEEKSKINEVVNMSEFPDSQYFLYLKNETGLVHSKKIIKAKN